MTYFGFLARFIVLPLLTLRLLLWLDRKRGKDLPQPLTSWSEDVVLAGHAVVAVTYTTPWDNYLVASNVWSYDPKLVTGVTLGWVPIEEYTFFVLQSLLTGSWMQFLARRIPADTQAPEKTYLKQRLLVTGGLSVLWLASMNGLLRGSDRSNYLGLILGWSLPPIMFQIAFGGDILWKNRALIASSILPATAYLGAVDSLAIGAGTWAISPQQTTGAQVVQHLPFEELLFFFVTNVLLVFGVTLVQSKESENRLPKFMRAWYFRNKARIMGEV